MKASKNQYDFFEKISIFENMPIKYRILFLGVACSFLGIWKSLGIFQERYPDAFTLNKVVYDQKGDFASTPCLNLSNQTFSYIGHGSQSIAFESEDHTTVLKLFLKEKIEGKKKYHVGSPLNLISSYYQKKELRRRQKKQSNLVATFQCYVRAFDGLKEETGLIAMHLTATEDPSQCFIKDWEGKKWTLDLARASFVLQKRAQPLFEIIKNVDQEKLLVTMDAFLERRAKKGFRDLGQGRIFDRNYGFVNDQIILMDVGRLGFSEEVRKNPKMEIEKMQQRFRERLVILQSPQ